MKTMQGISASPGIVAGKAFVYYEDTVSIPKYGIDDHEIDSEYERFIDATDRASSEITELKKKVEDSTNGNEVRFLDSHLLMLRDPEFTGRVQKGLRDRKMNVEWILSEAMEEFVRQLQASGDAYLRERSIDIHDVAQRVLNHLLFRERISLADISEEVVLVAHNLLPSEALQMNKRMIKGIAMDAGGKTSHTAILARSFELPAVLGLKNICKNAQGGDEIIVDGNSGVVILRPEKETLLHYRQTRQEWEKREVDLLTLNELPAETKDGKCIALKANIEVAEEVESVLSHGSDGIGLFRSEFLFLQSGVVATEEIQYEFYSSVLKKMKDRPVTIRTLDVGGDKLIPDIEELDERNPILGWRAVRFCLARLDIFKAQLRAVLRASVHGNLHIMFPMISGIEELRNVLDVLEETKEDLRREGIEFNEKIPVGIMIEVPSAALTADILAKEVHFFSIGTNDLIQYTIAVDRGNEKIAYLYEPFHPAVLRLLKTIIESAHRQGIPVGMCGEMAGDPIASVILLGLGLDEYSMSPFGIPEIKKIIRSITLTEAEELVGTIMDMRSFEEIDEYVKTWMHGHFDLPSYLP
jgi:phosphoenolpyruvate-protein phosphotransferase (PTS system enzyme I)